MAHFSQKRDGFTLIELAIVLTLTALVIGGIVVGKSLIRSAQLQAVPNEITRYEQAVVGFRDKYFALPGDFSAAEAIWGTDPGGCPGTPTNISSPQTKTCNGNGDGHIGYFTQSGHSNAFELYRAWQQLADAGMINGSYDGITGTGGGIPGNDYNSLYGINTPASQVPGGGYTLMYQSTPTDALENPIVGHYFTFGGQSPTIHIGPGILTAAEVAVIDNKVDDGVPFSGLVQQTYASACVVNPGSKTNQYNYSSSALCGIIFLVPHDLF